MQLKSLLIKLNLSYQDGLFSYDDLQGETTDFLSVRIKEFFSEQLKPDVFFCINDEPLILFFDYKKERDIELLEKKIWNLNQSPVIFINDGNQWIIKNGFNFLNKENTLNTLSNDISDFEYFEIITGKSWERYQKDFKQKNRVDFYLLKNIEDTRKCLTDEKTGNLPDRVANFLIGRVIFVRYLIDRNVELDKYNISKKEDFHKILSNHNDTYTFFQELKDDFNGNLFPLKYKIKDVEIEEKDYVTESHLSVIANLLKGAEIKTGQSSLFDIYDFSIIPVEFISNVYEKFIGIDNQANNGAYYTPLFLVDYIQKDTVSKYLRDNLSEYNCKVLDPACGSGIFLVETYRKIIAQYLKNNPLNFNDDKEYDQYKETLKTLLIDNIFGIDEDENAISVAIFSLYITLLDHLKPKKIIGIKFPVLEDKNFFVADFFNTKHLFNSTLEKHHFNFILGNPPWKTKHPKQEQLFEKYIEGKKILENSNLEIENREIAEAFLVRVSNFNFDETAFIIVSKILYKISRKKEKKGVFRKYFLTNFLLRKVVELSSVRHQVFNDSAVAPATILFYKKEKDNQKLRENVVEHISLKPNVFFETFKLMVIEKYDVKEIAQRFFIDEDWIWKVLVYGNVLDYYFIKRLKKYNSIYECISDEKKFIYGKGISVGGGDKNTIEEHKTIKLSVNSKKGGLTPYHIKYSDNFLEVKDFVHRPRGIELFKKPVLLVGKGVNKKFRAKSSISDKDVIYTDAITGIKPLNKESELKLYFLEALFNSSFFSYFLVNTNSSIGIEREQSHDKEDKFSVPFAWENNNSLKRNTDKLKKVIQSIESGDFEDYKKQQFENQKTQLENLIESELLKFYKLSNQEKNLIDYTNNVIVPLLKGNELEKKQIFRKISFEENYLEEYAQIFVKHFEKRFNSDNHYFEVDILYSNHTILMKFKINSKPSESKSCVNWKNKEDKELLKNIASLSFENLGNSLYLQKDIKGFENDFFYVAKPNEYKLWHSAIAHLDLTEFVDAFYKQKN